MKLRTRSGLSSVVAVLLFFAMQGGCGAGEQPEAVVLKGVSFTDKSAILKASSGSALEKLAQELLADPSITIEINCHVTASGNALHDAKLSRDRAEALRRWLMNRGVAFYRLQVADANTLTPAAAVPAAEREPAAERVEIARIRKSFPVAKIPVRAFRFEPVADGREVLHDFLLQNTGDAPLNISKVRTG